MGARSVDERGGMGGIDHGPGWHSVSDRPIQSTNTNRTDKTPRESECECRQKEEKEKRRCREEEGGREV